MKKLTLPFAILGALLLAKTTEAQIPKFDHVVVVMEENYSYAEIIGSSYAPVLTALSREPYCANFTKAYAITHPSEPNYLDLFSGNNQGVTTDISGPASNAPFNDCNIGASVIAAGHTFIGYSENQPSVGWISGDNGNYATKHCPWINWQLGSADVIPSASDVPYTGYWPDSNSYSTLPTMAWVIPNQVDDMHNGSSSTAIPAGDNWFHANMMPLVRWATNPANKTLVCVIWDEDDGSAGNNIPCLFASGGWVNGGNVTTTINFYNILRTWEDMYGLPYCGSSSTATDVPNSIWNLTAINNIQSSTANITLGPVPAKNEMNVNISSEVSYKASISLIDISGRVVKEIPVQIANGNNTININTSGLSTGVYDLRLSGEKINISKKFVVQN